MKEKGGGFGQSAKPKKRVDPQPVAPMADGEYPAAPPSTAAAPAQSDDDKTASVLERAGIKRSPKYRELSLPPTPDPPVSEPGILSRVPVETQNNIERVLVGCAGLSLLFFISSGIAVCAESFALIYKWSLPPSLTGVLSVLTPALSPALGVTLLCSVTLGLFKQAQFSGGAEGIVYREDDE